MILGNLSGGIAYFSSDSIQNNTNSYKNNIKEKLNIFPNPTNNSFTIISEVKGLVQIYNLMGSIVLSSLKEENRLTVNTLHLAKGIYTVKLNKTIEKLIID